MSTSPICPPQTVLPDLPFENWMGAKQVAAEFGVNEDSVLRWWHEGLPTGKDIPREYVRLRGFRNWLFHPRVVDFIRGGQAELVLRRPRAGRGVQRVIAW